jgi:hypothetical protein
MEEHGGSPSSVAATGAVAAAEFAASSSEGTHNGAPSRSVTSLLERLTGLGVAQQTKKSDVKERYAFWETQPVMQFAHSRTGAAVEVRTGASALLVLHASSRPCCLLLVAMAD